MTVGNLFSHFNCVFTKITYSIKGEFHNATDLVEEKYDTHLAYDSFVEKYQDWQVSDWKYLANGGHWHICLSIYKEREEQ